MQSNQHSRRQVLQATAGLAAGAVLSGDAVAADTDANPHETVPTTPAEIRAAFDDVPHLQDPTASERSTARHHFPDEVVPDEGPIPDPTMQTAVQLDAEPWLLASVYEKGQRRGDSERQPIEDLFLERRRAVEQWVLPDGTNAVDAVVAALQVEP